MAKGRDRRARKRKERERRVRRARNLRRGAPARVGGESEDEPLGPVDDYEEPGWVGDPDDDGLDALRHEQMLRIAWRRRTGRQDDPREDAQDLAFVAMGERDPVQAAALATEALESDPECSDALAVLAALRPRPEARVAGLREAVRAAERAVGGAVFLEEHAGRLAEHVEAAPYLRARSWLARALLDAGRPDEAEAHLRALVALDPSDVATARALLVTTLLERGDGAGASEVLAGPAPASHDDGYDAAYAAFAAWARVLARFLEGDRAGARRAVRLARRTNPVLEDVLLAELPGRTPRRRAEADHDIVHAAYAAAAELGRLWRVRRRALTWLDDGARATSERERRAALASYRPPVAALLRRGEPTPTQPREEPGWAAAPPEGLGADDAPELSRMARDPALHEADGDAAFAPVHAWRALVGLRAPEAAATLVALARERWDDDRLADDLGAALVALGPGMLPDAVALLADASAEPDARVLAADALADLAAAHPDTRDGARDALLDVLRGHAETDAELNAVVLGRLLDVAPDAARAEAPLVREAYEAGHVAEWLAPWEQVRGELGLG